MENNNWDLLKWSVEEWMEQERKHVGTAYDSGKFVAFQKVYRTMLEFEKSQHGKQSFLVEVKSLA